MRIFLIANNKKTSISWAKKINKQYVLDSRDYIIRFNHAESASMRLFAGKTTHVFFRIAGEAGNESFHGVKSNKEIKNSIILKNKVLITFGTIIWDKHIDLVPPLLKQIEYKNSIQITEQIIIYKKFHLKITGRSPSTGLMALFHYLDIYPKAEIYLIGFDFHNGIVGCHNFLEEQKFVNKLVKQNDKIKLINES